MTNFHRKRTSSSSRKHPRTMSKKRGLSLEEKRQKLLEIFYERKTFFQLKELEKIAPKEKGITPMSVKEVLQSLVDDNMVDSERIGSSNYFWSYPSKALHMRNREIKSLEKQISSIKNEISENEEKLVKVKTGKEQTDERAELLNSLKIIQEENKKLADELEQYKRCDPEVLKGIKESGDVALESANRWTDNIFVIKSWCSKRFNIEGKDINKQFGIPEDFDYLEE